MIRKDAVLELPKFLPKQQFAYDTLANELLMGGATRGGKTFFNKLALIRWCSCVSNLRCDIFRLHSKDVHDSYMEGEGSFYELLSGWEKRKLVHITQEGIEFLWNGSGISLEHLGTEGAKNKGQGTPKQVRIYDEAAQLMESRFRFLRGWVSMTEPHKDNAARELEKLYPNFTYEERREFFPKIIYSTNPIGPSAGYFRRNFVKAAPRYQIFEAPLNDGGAKRIYIPFKVKDNPFENEEAVKKRISGFGDEQMTDALLNENWDSGVGDFIREYNENTHKIEDFTPPDHWVKFRAFDWGGDDPFCVLWFTISDGEEFVDDYGETRCYQRNAIIVYREWYGCDANDQASGINMLNVDIARGIASRTPEETTGITLTDNLPFQRRGGDLMKAEFFRNGVPLTHANTDRVIGWKAVRDRLKGKDGEPLLYIVQSCKYLREYLPQLQRHATKINDAVEDGEATHACDTLRYGIATHQISLPKSPGKPPQLAPIEYRKSVSPKDILKQRKAGNGKRRKH